ncbi:MAG TPA: hypothetical protein VFV95_13775 [Vicinamibacterales bacterium]|nr:hypothetical protein [Vicinamibacterales bacterium]
MKTTGVVQERLAAVNARAVPAVMARSSGDIEVRGPSGVTPGQPNLRDWVERTGGHHLADALEEAGLTEADEVLP